MAGERQGESKTSIPLTMTSCWGAVPLHPGSLHQIKPPMWEEEEDGESTWLVTSIWALEGSGSDSPSCRINHQPWTNFQRAFPKYYAYPRPQLNASGHPIQYDKQQQRTVYTVRLSTVKLTKASVGGGGGAGGGGTGMVEDWTPSGLAKKPAQQNTETHKAQRLINLNKYISTQPKNTLAANRFICYIF